METCNTVRQGDGNRQMILVWKYLPQKKSITLMRNSPSSASSVNIAQWLNQVKWSKIVNTHISCNLSYGGYEQNCEDLFYPVPRSQQV